MFVGLLMWWYGDGLTGRLKATGETLARVNDFFSVGLLANTLFAPFRQISTGKVRGALDVQVRALIDNLTSRLIGAFVRLTMIFVALLSSVAIVVWGGLVLAGWLILPLLPICGLVVSLAWSLQG